MINVINYVLTNICDFFPKYVNMWIKYGTSPSKRDWLSVPRGEHRCAGTPRPICGQQSLISPELLLSFLLPREQFFFFVSRSTFPYFLYLPHFLQFLVLPVLSHTSSPKILLSMIPPSSSSILSHIPLPISPMYFLFLLHFLIPYFPSFPYTSYVCPALPLPKFTLACPSPAYFLISRTSLYCGFCLAFALLCLQRVFLRLHVLLRFSWKIYL